MYLYGPSVFEFDVIHGLTNGIIGRIGDGVLVREKVVQKSLILKYFNLNLTL